MNWRSELNRRGGECRWEEKDDRASPSAEAVFEKSVTSEETCEQMGQLQLCGGQSGCIEAVRPFDTVCEF